MSRNASSLESVSCAEHPAMDSLSRVLDTGGCGGFRSLLLLAFRPGAGNLNDLESSFRCSSELNFRQIRGRLFLLRGRPFSFRWDRADLLGYFQGLNHLIDSALSERPNGPYTTC